MQKVEIPNSIKEIGNSSFLGCSNLEEIILSENIINIYDSAFKNCIGLSHVVLKGNVKTAGKFIFSGCENLKTVGPLKSGSDIEYGWSDSVPGAIFWDSEIEKVSLSNSIKNINNESFGFCKNLIDIDLRQIINIGNRAFICCDKLSDIEFPMVQTIGKEAFENCRNIKEITLPDCLQEIGENAIGYDVMYESDFDSIEAQSINQLIIKCNQGTVGELYKNNNQWKDNRNTEESLFQYKENEDGTLTIIGFTGDSKEVNVYIPEYINEKKVVCIGTNAMRRSAARKIVIPETVEKLEWKAFSECVNLKKVIIPESTKVMDFAAFWRCRKLDSIGPIGSGCDIEFGWTKEIPAYAFSGWELYFTHIIIPDGIETIGEYAFTSENGSYLKSISVPPSVTKIGKLAIGYYKEGENTLYRKCPNLVLEGYAGSLIEKYATINGIAFKSVGSVKKKQEIKGTDSIIKTYGDFPFNLNIQSTGDGKLTYECNPDNIASISKDGIVTIRGVGKAVINITASETFAYEEATKTISLIVNRGTGSTSTKEEISSGLSNKIAVNIILKKGNAVINIKKSVGAKKYQIQYSQKKNFCKATLLTTKKKKYVISKLKNKTTYFIRVRMIDSKGKASKWTKAEKVKIK